MPAKRFLACKLLRIATVRTVRRRTLFQGTRGMPRVVNRIAHYAPSATALDNNPPHGRLRPPLCRCVQAPPRHGHWKSWVWRKVCATLSIVSVDSTVTEKSLPGTFCKFSGGATHFKHHLIRAISPEIPSAKARALTRSRLTPATLRPILPIIRPTAVRLAPILHAGSAIKSKADPLGLFSASRMGNLA